MRVVSIICLNFVLYLSVFGTELDTCRIYYDALDLIMQKSDLPDMETDFLKDLRSTAPRQYTVKTLNISRRLSPRKMCCSVSKKTDTI